MAGGVVWCGAVCLLAADSRSEGGALFVVVVGSFARLFVRWVLQLGLMRLLIGSMDAQMKRLLASTRCSVH
ncbi:hypothetical protein LX32DRAFT_636420 [Colletotrichum zoysiae]|uniref:Uncharacterized protein n=1 Tax=Colletotrichum zoysiae TaxID=1216348 RepID=A0AAD9HQE1_9PEZI|nr:hypothetical protein LX32DRAFT_636420 [Colletotrichum zoysiae]